LDSLSSIIKNF